MLRTVSRIEKIVNWVLASLFLSAIVLTGCIMQETREWEEYATKYKCVQVAQSGGSLWITPAGQEGLVPMYVEGSKTYICNNGTKHVR